MDITHILMEWISHYGALGYFALMYINGIGVPLIPAETLLLASDIFVAKGILSLFDSFTASLLGAVLGNMSGYFIGRLGGQILVEKFIKFLKIDEDKFKNFEKIVRNKGAYFLIVARFIPVARELSGSISGALGMQFYKYMLGNVIGACLWIFCWSILPYMLEHSLH